MKVELEPGVWLAEGEGDPPRTLDEENAKKFNSLKDAVRALAEARKYRKFDKAVISDRTGGHG
jgi:hypothetical protein